MEYEKRPVCGQNKDYYYVDTNGEVWKNGGKSRIFPHETSEGFKIVELVTDHHRQTTKTYFVHQLVADAFLPVLFEKDVRTYVGFKDGNRGNCAVENLYRYDRWEGMRDIKEVIVCKETGICYETYREAAEATNCNEGNINKCCKGRLKSTNNLHWEIGYMDVTRHQHCGCSTPVVELNKHVSEEEIIDIINNWEV